MLKETKKYKRDVYKDGFNTTGNLMRKREKDKEISEM